MKTFANVMKVIAALAAVAGVVYVVMNYGDKIVAWFKERFCCCGCCGCCEEAEEISGEEASVEEAPVEDVAVQAEEADFQG